MRTRSILLAASVLFAGCATTQPPERSSEDRLTRSLAEPPGPIPDGLAFSGEDPLPLNGGGFTIGTFLGHGHRGYGALGFRGGRGLGVRSTSTPMTRPTGTGWSRAGMLP